MNEIRGIEHREIYPTLNACTRTQSSGTGISERDFDVNLSVISDLFIRLERGSFYTIIRLDSSAKITGPNFYSLTRLSQNTG